MCVFMCMCVCACLCACLNVNRASVRQVKCLFTIELNDDVSLVRNRTTAPPWTKNGCMLAYKQAKNNAYVYLFLLLMIINIMIIYYQYIFPLVKIIINMFSRG